MGEIHVHESLLGRSTFEMFEPAWSTRAGEDDPGAPVVNDNGVVDLNYRPQ